MKLKVLIALFITSALLIATVGCKKGGNETIKLGIAGAHSGDLASYGLPTVKAAELVVAEVNATGGINGKMVELVIEDDMCKPEIATNTATKLVGEEVVAVVGHICSGATKAALSIYRDSETVCISPSATNPPLTQSGDYPNFFRTIAPDDSQAQLEVDFVLNTLKLSKIAVIHDKGDYGKGFALFAKEFIEKSGKGEVLMFEGITPGSLSYSAIINKIQASGAEAIIFGGYHPEASKLVTGLRKKGLTMPFLSDDGVKDITFIKVAGEYGEGVYASGPVDTTKNPIAMAATKAHQEKYGSEPGAFFLNAYAATVAILNAIEKSGADYASLTDGLRANKVETPLGLIGFDKRGDAIGAGFSMYIVKDGEFVEVK